MSVSDGLKSNLRPPAREDGAAVFGLIQRCPPLDANSMYCNLLQCSHFADTSVAALADGVLVGFISGYLVPGRPDSLFIWQVAVGPDTRRHRPVAPIDRARRPGNLRSTSGMARHSTLPATRPARAMTTWRSVARSREEYGCPKTWS